MIRKWTPFCYGHNWSGGIGGYISPFSGLYFWYFRKFYVGINIHPNRIRQIGRLFIKEISG